MYYIYFLYSETADKYYVGHSEDPRPCLFRRHERKFFLPHRMQHPTGNVFTPAFNELIVMNFFHVAYGL